MVRAIAGGQGRVRTGRIVGPTGTPGVLIGQMIGSSRWNGVLTNIAPNPVNLFGNVSGAALWSGALTNGAAAPVFQTDFTALSSLPAEISLSRATSGTRVDSSGTRQTSAIDAARFDYGWNGSIWVPKGLLAEEQRSTIVKDSDDLSTANWASSGVTRTVSAITGANNSSFMTQMAAAAAGVGQVYTASNITIVSGANYLLAADFKKTNWNYVYLNVESDPPGHWITIVLDLSTGAITQTAVGGTSGTLVSVLPVETLRNGIVRIGLIGSIAQATAYFSVGFAAAATGNTFSSGYGNCNVTPVGTETFLVNAALLSAGSTPTSHIPATTAAVTRSADLLSSNSPLTGYLTAGPSVWEFQDEATGSIARAAYAAGAFDWPVNKWYRSMGVYPAGTDTSGHMVVGSGY